MRALGDLCFRVFGRQRKAGNVEGKLPQSCDLPRIHLRKQKGVLHNIRSEDYLVLDKLSDFFVF